MVVAGSWRFCKGDARFITFFCFVVSCPSIIVLEYDALRGALVRKGSFDGSLVRKASLDEIRSIVEAKPNAVKEKDDDGYSFPCTMHAITRHRLTLFSFWCSSTLTPSKTKPCMRSFLCTMQ